MSLKSFLFFTLILYITDFSINSVAVGAARTKAPITKATNQNDIAKVSAAELLEEIKNDSAAVTVVNFWATWCSPCKEEMPELAKIQNQYPKKTVRLILVTADEDKDLPSARKFLMEKGINFKSFAIKGSPDSFMEAFNREWKGGLPATFLFNHKGKSVDFWVGQSNFEKIQQKVDPLIPR